MHKAAIQSLKQLAPKQLDHAHICCRRAAPCGLAALQFANNQPEGAALLDSYGTYKYHM